jgi:predicted transcriptional regulator
MPLSGTGVFLFRESLENDIISDMASPCSSASSVPLTLSYWSQAEIARRLDVPASSVSLWLSGERAPRIERVLALAELLGVTPAALAGYLAEQQAARRNLLLNFA